MRLAILTVWLMLAGAQAQTPVKPFPQYDGAELVHRFPELAGIQFASGEGELAGLLRLAGQGLERMLAGLPAVSAGEEIHELRFERAGGVEGRMEDYRYIVRDASRGAELVLEEFRVVPATRARAAPPAESSFLLLGHFEALLSYLLPENRGQSDFRYAGRLTEAGADVAVIAFAQHAGSSLRSHVVTGAAGQTARIHGLVWLDAASGRILRIHAELADQIEGFPFETLSTDVVFRAVGLSGASGSAWLPARATVHGQFAGGEVHSIHRFRDYGILDQDGAAGTGPPADATEDAFELLARGIGLEQAHKPAEAVPAMRASVRLEPESALARFHLAVALNSTGDLRGAEAEIREGLKRRPEDGPAHNFLAVVLMKQGDLKAASEELRISARLQPRSAVVQFNLGQVLEKVGKAEEAAAAYRAASALEPGNAEYRTHQERLERRTGAGGQDTLRVEVRQVLVPVIATNREGHHVTGLKQADFHVFEDGVEQKITSFSSESVGAEMESGGKTEAPSSNASAVERNPIRRTYVLCIDTLHTSMEGLANARAAVEKVLRAERPGDAQYILAAVGSTTEILANATRDPVLVSQALDERKFRARLMDSRRGSIDVELSQFIRSLDEARSACDTGSASCQGRKRSLPMEAERISTQERVYNLLFLRQLHNLVEQLSHGNDRRTLVLISDGFELVPGKAARTLLNAYFPEFRFAALGTVDRMQAEFDQVVRLAARSNITIDTVDTRGVYTQGYFQASNGGSGAAMMPAVLGAMNQSASDLRAALLEVAAATGGLAFSNNNDLQAGLTRALADGREYYMLGYISSNEKLDGTFRAIQVQVRGQRVKVQAKKGYWAMEQ
ncbi:VWA domain-containing protein [Paludibaculum fermentans]|uniref:VWA domain-containing protein n=1 Tax=Paludibaculum fermentans TaxID=1473598 RepID=A0A7S7NQJ6_PALFE|nr:VWA domain-containing protein [Paludibaculum fermentans]QOY87900.1 VWA domain-containing protein [Paludibaculum fermentans]